MTDDTMPIEQRPATPEPAPLVVADGLSLATKRGAVFTDLRFSWPGSRLAAVVGPSGSGRSSLLLALCGRMRGLTGGLRIGGVDAIVDSRSVRATTSVARIARLVELEDQLRVGECITERALIDAVAPQDAELAVSALERTLGVEFPRTRLVDELPALEQTLLAVVLATLRPSRLVVLDDADRSLPLTEQRELYAALSQISATGPAVVVSTVEEAALPNDVPRLVLTRKPTTNPTTTEA